ncbi:hypothetical protein LOTGIDRAFT_91252, partial [Lottia gigantea]
DYSDAESFNGKIVYNPDGSAYIIEESESSDNDSLDIPQQDGAIVDDKGTLISSSPAVKQQTPIMHSYRVYDVRTKDNNNDTKSESEYENGPTVPTKPILMCFICRLSFGQVKSFHSHAANEHVMKLSEKEVKILNSKNSSAIIQGVGKDKHPLMSFLEPVSPNTDNVVSTKSSSVKPKKGSPKSSSETPLHSSPLPLPQPSFLGMCDEHPQGRLQGVECPKCDIVLSSSQSLGGHMTMMHSRNSCKTLKCPKCNWHYKYQETLDIHMKEKHPENDAQCIYCLSNQSHPRLARGETYSCGYKPYRCEVCNYSTTTKGNLSIHMQSDKHINNMQDLANGSTEMKMPPAAPPTPTTSATTATVPPSFPQDESQMKKLQKPKQTWRCDVCNYETTVARNLRIHMTSEKHTHNMMVLQQNMKHMQQDMHMQMNQLMMLGQQDPMFTSLPTTMGGGMFPYDQSMMLAAGMPPGFELPVNLTKENGNPMEIDEIPDAAKLFHCCVCNNFTTDSLEALHQHLQLDRTKQQENEHVTVAGGTYLCNLCQYKTNLKANFQLHSKTDKHIQRLQLVNHIKEGGVGNEWRLKYLNVSNPIQVRCNSCDYYTNSIHKLNVHTTNLQHESSAQLFRHIQYEEAKLNSSSKYYHCAICQYSTKVKLNLIHHVQSVQHLQNDAAYKNRAKEDGGQTLDVDQIFQVRQLKDDDDKHKIGNHCLNKQCVFYISQHNIGYGKKESIDSPYLSGSVASNIQSFMLISKDSYHGNEVKINGSDNEAVIKVKQYNCPLCQDECVEISGLKSHLLQAHNVKQEGLDRILLIAEQTESDVYKLLSTKPQEKSSTVDTSMVSDKNEDGQYRCQTCSSAFGNIDQLYAHQNELGHLELKQTPRGPGYLCWKKGCNQYFKTAQALQVHFREIHARRNIIGDANFSCSQCSLVFQSEEKLAIHNQYHLVKSTTSCPVCTASMKGVQQTFEHLESAHGDLCKAELEKHLSDLNSKAYALFSNPGFDKYLVKTSANNSKNDSSSCEDEENDSLNNSANLEDSLDHSNADGEKSDAYKEQQFMEDYMNSQAIAEGNYEDPTRKFKCHRCRVAFTKQNYLTSHNKTLQHRKGEKSVYPVDRYLDPNRPFKCDVCKESFTQKSILLVHYNSVSHLHKLKQAAHTGSLPAATSALSTTQTTSAVSTSLDSSPPSTATTTNSSSTAPSSSTSTSSTASSSQDSGRKPYRCNICRVAYNQGATLDIHIRSVAHQTRASKIHELAMTGRIDITLPLIENPDLGKVSTQQAQAITDMISQTQAKLNDLDSTLGTGLICPKCQSSFATPEALLQHQKIYCYLGSHAALARPRNIYGRFKPQIQKNLLENIGFECVMQFNENLLRPVKKEIEENVESRKEEVGETNCEEMDTSEKKEESDDKKKQIDMPEMNRSHCSKCSKDFSSVWVLKTHQEEVHKTMVPIELVESFGSQFKKEFELKEPKEIEPPLTPQASSEKTNQPEMPPPPPPSTSQLQNQFDISQLMPMFGMMPMPLSMMQLGMPSHMMPMMLPGMDVSSFMPPMPVMDPNFASAQQQIQHQAAAAAAAAANQKRVRTRISDDQLKILRAHFDITNSPSDDQIKQMSDQSGLPQKVIKHWFRNTLFKERQRNKDSPYNFNNPPSTSIDLDEYEKTGKIPDIKQEPSDDEDNEDIDMEPEREPNRTRFTDYQIKMLQDYFEQNAYPKDDELEHLSKMLSLSPRVIVVWFQNARQKARKIYENQPASEVKEPASVFQRTPGLNYQCKKCSAVFQRYYELIKHQKRMCGSDQKNNNNSNNHQSTSSRNQSSSSSGHSSGNNMAAYNSTFDEGFDDDEETDSDCHSPNGDTNLNSYADDSACATSVSQLPTFQCDKCDASFNRLSQWQEHQQIHNVNPALFPGFGPNSAFDVLQTLAHHEGNSALKRKFDSEDDSDQPRDKRLRTTILPEQLDYLYQKYQLDCNPSRKQLENISNEVGLKKRVVQVWFQNTRARERKGQYRAHQQIIHKRCPFCRALFRAKSALESHLATKHPEEMAKKDFNIDTIPDASLDTSPTTPQSLPGSLPTTPNSAHDLNKILPPGMPNYLQFMPQPGMGFSPGSDSVQMSMHQLYEDSFKRYINDLSSTPKHAHSISEGKGSSKRSETESRSQSTNAEIDAPLDLSKPIKIDIHDKTSDGPSTDMSAFSFDDHFGKRRRSLDESISDTMSEAAGDHNDDMSSMLSNPTSPSNSHINKRYRTQMTSIQVRVMKILFQDYKTPTMAECELLGREIGLPKRVVQVWFQNARAKEKKSKMNFPKGYGEDNQKTPEKCSLCSFKYSHKFTVQDHIFTRKHIDNVRKHIQS